MSDRKNTPANSRPAYVVSPCYRLVLPAEALQRDDRRADRCLDTPRGSSVRRSRVS